MDHVTIPMFDAQLGTNLKNLSEALRTGPTDRKPSDGTRSPNRESKEKRPLGIPTVRDRVVQTALRMVLEPIFEREFAEHSYGFRPGRGCKDALRRVDQLLKEGYTHIVDADLKSYFDTIPHDRLMAQIGQKVADGRVLSLIEAFLKQGVLDGLREWTPERGSRRARCISPLLSNIYLNPLDHLMAEQGFEMVRYADDFVILCRSPEDAARALEPGARMDGGSRPDSASDQDARSSTRRTKSFDFLGYRFEQGRTLPARQEPEEAQGNDPREDETQLRGESSAIIASLNPTLRGWFEYFKHCHRTTFPQLDDWIRMRLRSFLRKRRAEGDVGEGRTISAGRMPSLPNMGYSLTTAHARTVNPL